MWRVEVRAVRRSMLRSGQVKQKTARLSQHAHTCMFHAFVGVLHPCVLCVPCSLFGSNRFRLVSTSVIP